MSIDNKLQKLLTDRSLYELESLFTGDETVRTMIVSADILTVVTPPFADTVDGGRLGEFRAWLDNFLEGGELTVAENPDTKPPDTMLARVHPVDLDLWSIRVTLPEETPGIRSLGAFAGKDKFVALTWDRREDIEDFDCEIEAATERWTDYFERDAPCARFTGESLDEYLTNYRAV
jgi:hypothetical protein